MSYASIAAMATSGSLQNRVAACAATQDLGGLPAPQWAAGNLLAIVAQPGWADAWDAAVAAQNPNVNPDTGYRNDVITDAMILSGVQAVRSAQAGS